MKDALPKYYPPLQLGESPRRKNLSPSHPFRKSAIGLRTNRAEQAAGEKMFEKIVAYARVVPSVCVCRFVPSFFLRTRGERDLGVGSRVDPIASWMGCWFVSGPELAHKW